MINFTPTAFGVDTTIFLPKAKIIDRQFNQKYRQSAT
ncbi:hypothetical protein SAMN05421780_110159 [Flexibacter flexilis DSM 6793]|uniref:Uncharacterized protein n=1 Tax=Flexibacter flexilis DSM 6793 TaxID=927664 RepID=A0A1I1MMU6_9BACT|nr:hypothetical protein SAMN05421780_110159 [Flexibacter flexilis DSM 6793]